MNHRRCYEQLIERAERRYLFGYSEKHHIQPKCLGGTDSPDNIVRLTPEEHYIAHLMLVRMNPGNHRLLWAAVAMTNQTGRMGRQNKLYGWLRREFAERVGERNRGLKRSEEARRKMSIARLGKKRGPHSAETKRKMSEASKGKPKSIEHCAALSVAKKGRKTGPHSAEWRKHQSEGITAAMIDRDNGKYRTAEYRRRQSIQMKNIWMKRKGLVEVEQ